MVQKESLDLGLSINSVPDKRWKMKNIARDSFHCLYPYHHNRCDRLDVSI